MKLGIAVMTVSDSRTAKNDTSGDALVEMLQSDGHRLVDRALVADDIYLMRQQVSNWIVDANVQAVLTTGGTGITGRDSTPEAVRVLLDKEIPGFGEVFRSISYAQIGTSTIASRALCGVANGTFIFCMPGSTGACRTAWEQIISSQLDSDTKPCNLVQLMPRLGEK